MIFFPSDVLKLDKLYLYFLANYRGISGVTANLFVAVRFDVITKFLQKHASCESFDEHGLGADFR